MVRYVAPLQILLRRSSSGAPGGAAAEPSHDAEHSPEPIFRVHLQRCGGAGSRGTVVSVLWSVSQSHLGQRGNDFQLVVGHFKFPAPAGCQTMNPAYRIKIYR